MKDSRALKIVFEIEPEKYIGLIYITVVQVITDYYLS
jgi:hypothetical protein